MGAQKPQQVTGWQRLALLRCPMHPSPLWSDNQPSPVMSCSWLSSRRTGVGATTWPSVVTGAGDRRMGLPESIG